jgi:exopolysaccharide biosynthesis polyprenyl glycosylphosphotransferase
MIPRRFFWSFDIVILLGAFTLAYLLTPSLQHEILQIAPANADWAAALSVPTQPSRIMPPISDLLWVFLCMAPVTILFLELSGSYAPLFEQSHLRLFANAVMAPVAGLSLITLILFALKAPNWSRLFIFSFTGCASFGLLIYRNVLRAFLMRVRAVGRYSRNVLFIGDNFGIEWMCQYFAKHVPSADYRAFAYLKVMSTQPPPDVDTTQIKELGDVADLGQLLIHEPIHEVIVVHPIGGGDWIRQVIRSCDYFGLTLRIVPQALLSEEQRTLAVPYGVKPLRFPAIILSSPHLNSEAQFLKRLIDIVVSTALLLILTPVFLIIAVAIKLTTPSYPVFYRWRVVGRNGVEFTGYKFTTMRPDSEHLRTELQSKNEMIGPVFKIKDDPRRTPLGRFLRKYSLNELPQLWSVLKGDMSLVGPRPAFRHELERYEFWHKRKLSINPGITCLWQIRGRNKINQFDDWVRMDLEYIDNWSLSLDFKILLRTVWVVISGTGS